MRKTAAEILEIVRMHTVEVMDVSPDQVQRQVSLVDLDANSIDRAEIVTLTMESLELTFPVRELASAKNIGDLVDLLEARQDT